VFKRLGRIFGGLADLRSIQGGTVTTAVASGASWATRGTNIEADAAESPAVSDQIDGHWTAIASWRSAQSSLFTSMRSLAEKVVIRQVDLDASLATKDITTALKELIRQMKSSGDDIADSTVSAGAQTAVGSPTGTAKAVVSIYNRDGYVLQTPFAETLRFTTASDAQTGGATARNESMTVRGKAAVTDVAAYDWPSGSGCNVTVNLIDAQADNSRGNLLYNGDFETFLSTHTPQDWVMSVGVAGTDYTAAGSSDALTGSNAMKFIGDGSTLTVMRQTFDTAHSTTLGAGGTPAELEPNQQYAVGMWLKRNTALAAGVLRVRLTDGDNTVTSDVAGTANSFTIDLTALTGSYVFYSGVFRTPAVTPTSGYKLELAQTTAHDTGEFYYLDDIAFAKMTPLYNGGPSVAVFAGATNTVKDDQWTVAISCTMGGFASWLERVFSLRDKGLQFPYDSAGGETVADSLIA
jgi:hypothetical protein